MTFKTKLTTQQIIDDIKNAPIEHNNWIQDIAWHGHANITNCNDWIEPDNDEDWLEQQTMIQDAAHEKIDEGWN